MGDSFRLHGFQSFLTNIALKPRLIATLVGRGRPTRPSISGQT
jgi:hypothetical protein